MESFNYETFNYKDSVVTVRHYKTGKLNKEMRKKCFCCLKEIDNCESSLLINNYKYIPNVLLHKECFEEQKSKTDDLCNDIVSQYKLFKDLNSIFGSYTN